MGPSKLQAASCNYQHHQYASHCSQFIFVNAKANHQYIISNPHPIIYTVVGSGKIVLPRLELVNLDLVKYYLI